jgi:hypothetical protein
MRILSSSLVKQSFFSRFTKEENQVIIIQSVLEDLKSTSTGKLVIGLWESISKKLINQSPIHFRSLSIQAQPWVNGNPRHSS